MILPSRELMPIIHAALERGQRVRMTVTGSSMLPFLRDGDVVELEPVPSLLAPGDVLLVQCAGPVERYVLHRVVRMEGDTFFLRGDAQQQCEGPFVSRAILGKVSKSYRNGCSRAMGHGAWHFAGLIWARSTPLSLWLLRMAGRIRGFGVRVLQRNTLGRM